MTSALVLYAVLWFLTLLVVLPIRIKTQGDLGRIVPGTHAGAPEIHNLGRKIRLTTAIAAVIWVIVCGVILSGWISVSDFDWTRRLAPVE